MNIDHGQCHHHHHHHGEDHGEDHGAHDQVEDDGCSGWLPTQDVCPWEDEWVVTVTIFFTALLWKWTASYIILYLWSFLKTTKRSPLWWMMMSYSNYSHLVLQFLLNNSRSIHVLDLTLFHESDSIKCCANQIVISLFCSVTENQ